MIPNVAWRYAVNFPVIDTTVETFTFQTSLPTGVFKFVFKWLNGRWNGWVTIPSGDVRQIGCEPDVIKGTGYLDYGFVIHSALPALGLGDLIGSTLYVLKWK